MVTNIILYYCSDDKCPQYFDDVDEIIKYPENGKLSLSVFNDMIELLLSDKKSIVIVTTDPVVVECVDYYARFNLDANISVYYETDNTLEELDTTRTSPLGIIDFEPIYEIHSRPLLTLAYFQQHNFIEFGNKE